MTKKLISFTQNTKAELLPEDHTISFRHTFINVDIAQEVKKDEHKRKHCVM